MAQNNNKESNFVSAVVCLHDAGRTAADFFAALDGVLAQHFAHYELIAVNDGCTDDTVPALKAWAAEHLEAPLTVVNMSLRQGVEKAMNAGLDAAIGDFVFEFDRPAMGYDPDLIWQAYQKALTGFDVVNVCPSRQRLTSRAFYRVFNKFSNSPYKLSTDAFRLVSRRAVNRVKAISDDLAYRKAAYAASGLACASLTFEGTAAKDDEPRLDKAVDSLALYTDAGYKLSLGISMGMMVLTMVALVYTVAVFCLGQPIAGWTTTMLVLSAGLSGLFFILTIAVKYLNLLVRLTFKKQSYLIEGVEKLQK